MKHLLKLLDCKQEEITAILDLADQLKYERKHNITHRLLEGKSIGLIFQKSSTRTRVSFETGIFQLGGQALFYRQGIFRLAAANRFRIRPGFSRGIWTEL